MKTFIHFRIMKIETQSNPIEAIEPYTKNKEDNLLESRRNEF